jgi:hypothetical protein
MTQLFRFYGLLFRSMDIIQPAQVMRTEEDKPSIFNESNRVFTLRDLLNMNVREMPMIWEPFLPLGGVSFLVGSSDCGKSTLMRQLASAICRGDKTFLGQRLVSKYKNALIVSTEDDERGAAFSLGKQIGRSDVDYGDRLSFIFDHGNVLKDVENHLIKTPCDLLVVDSWSDTLKGNPNDFTAVRAAIEPWKSLGKRYGCTITLMHHTVKNSDKVAPDKNRVNGSQGIEAKARSVLELRHGTERNQRFLSILKGNYASEEAKGIAYALSFDSETLLFSSRGDSVNKAVICESSKRKYDWIKQEAVELRQISGLSLSNVRERLVEKYGVEKIPGLTWFKENL